MRVPVPAAVLLAALLLAACQQQEEGATPPDSRPQEPPSATVEFGPLHLQLGLDRSVVRIGEPVRVTLALSNQGEGDVVLFYRDSQRFDFEATAEGGAGAAWRWSAGKAFAQVLGEETLAPGDTLTYTEAWNQRGGDGQPLPPGDYRVRGVVVGCRDMAFADCEFAAELPLRIEP